MSFKEIVDGLMSSGMIQDPDLRPISEVGWCSRLYIRGLYRQFIKDCEEVASVC